jgi:hypothetical protein
VKLPLHHLPIVFLVASLMTAQAATLAVLPGTSIQAKINLAQAGDIVAIFGGTYNEDLVINKAIRLVEVSGQQVTLAGSLTFSGIVNAPPLDGFAVGSAGRGIAVENCTGLVFRNLSAQAGSGISVTGNSSLDVTDSTLSNLNCGGGTFRAWKCQAVNITSGGVSGEVWDCTLSGAFNHSAGKLTITKCTIAGNFDTQPSAQQTIAFRTAVAGHCYWRSKKAWFGYSEARSFNFRDTSEAKVVLVGNKFDRQGEEGNGIYGNVSNCSFLIANNRILRIRYHYEGDGKCGIDLRGGSNKATISNNYIQLQFSGYDYNGVRGDGIYVRDFEQAIIINNLIVGAKYGISAPFGVTAKNNLYWASPWGGGLREANGVAAEGTLYTDPLFVENEAPKLQATSPCLNAGTPDPRYNNRDGTRNTIGPAGGVWFDPDGWTTPNPVVVSFDVSPEQVLEGVDTEVILSEGLAVSAP